jgi:thiosulfate reductase cytochrome b subunit
MAAGLASVSFAGRSPDEDSETKGPGVHISTHYEVPAQWRRLRWPWLAAVLFALYTITAAASAATPPAAAAKVDAAAQNARCLECHDDPELKNDAGESMRVHGPDFAASVHGKEACSSCHTDALTKKHPREDLAPVGLGDCANCHADTIRTFVASAHGKGKDGSPATVESCQNCHEAPHEIKASTDPASAAHASNATDTCGTCHRPVKKALAASAHGAAAGEKAPTCVTCHGAHDVHRSPMPFAVKQALGNNCAGCHEKRFETFEDGFHGKATAIGFESSATCADCHGGHAILSADDPASAVHADNLTTTCGTCHESEVRSAGFVSFNPHIDYTDPNDNRWVHYIWLFMTALLIGVFGFFGIHMLLWFQRSLVAKLRGELPKHEHKGPWIRRFSGYQVFLHLTIIVSFLLLALSGLPLKFAGADWAVPLANLMGGAEMAAWWHRVAAIVTFGYFAAHIAGLVLGWFVKGERGYFWGWRSMTPNLGDAKDLWANLKYFLYLGPRPKFDRWTYWEKFDYLAVFWGVGMIGVSGLFLWFPGIVTQWLPGWTLNAAYVIHSDEALLATGFIFLFHFFHTHLRPEAFPMDPVVFTGAQPLERLKDERPREYERLVASGKLEELIVPEPSKTKLMVSYVFGFAAVAIGIALAIGIFVGLLAGYGL